MRKINLFMGHKFAFVALLSTLFLANLAGNCARAHEISPSIGDLSTEGRTVTLVLRLNLEAFIAEIDLDGDLDGVENTDATAQSAEYDILRALPPDALRAKFKSAWPNISRGFHLQANSQDVPFELDKIHVDAVGDIDLMRPSIVTLGAAISADISDLTFGWDKRFGTLILRHIGVENGYTGYLMNGETSPKIKVIRAFGIHGGATQSALQVFTDYIPVGFDHILPKGLDHILFVLGLFFLSIRLRPLLWQITAFTLAHSATMALGAFGWVIVAPSIVEPLIAASICYVAVDNIFTSRLSRWRPFVIFGFGLVHGLGFASVLGEVGLAQGHFFAALIGFNIGVEIGQITVIALAFLAVGAWFRYKRWYRARIAIPASVLIAAIGAFWVVERIFL